MRSCANNLAILLFAVEKFSALKNFHVHHCGPSMKYLNDKNFPIHNTFFSAQTHKKMLLWLNTFSLLQIHPDTNREEGYKDSLTTLNCDITAVITAWNAMQWTEGADIQTPIWVESTTEILQPNGLCIIPRSAEQSSHFQFSTGAYNTLIWLSSQPSDIHFHPLDYAFPSIVIIIPYRLRLL